MYTGTLIEDLIAAVERVKPQADDAEMHKARPETGVEANDTEVVPAGFSTLTMGSPIQLVAQRQHVAAEDFPLANARIWAVPSGAEEAVWAPWPL